MMTKRLAYRSIPIQTLGLAFPQTVMQGVVMLYEKSIKHEAILKAAEMTGVCKISLDHTGHKYSSATEKYKEKQIEKLKCEILKNNLLG